MPSAAFQSTGFRVEGYGDAESESGLKKRSRVYVKLLQKSPLLQEMRREGNSSFPQGPQVIREEP